MRVIIVLDSFKRDTILCLKIAESVINESEKNNLKNEVFIAQTGADIVRLALSCRSSIILHNYSRLNNQSTLRKLALSGVNNLVLDTEGFPLWAFSKKGITSKKLLKYVSKYFTWGIEQKNFVDRVAKKAIAVECGSFRHQKIKNIKLNKKKACLALTSSPISNPGLSSREESIKATQKSSRLSENEMSFVVAEQERIQQRICKLIPLLASHFESVLIRVHPFESKRVYEDCSKNIKNIIFSQSQDIKIDLDNCSTVLHGYSTAGIEAYLSGKETFVTEISDNLPEFLEKYFKVISYGSQILSESNIDKLLAKENLSTKPNFNSIKTKLNSFYGINKTAKEGIEIIKNEIINQTKEKNFLNITKLFFRISGLIYLQLRRFIGQEPKPKKLKSIKSSQLNQVLKTQNINIKLKELNYNSCIWKVIS